MTKAEIQMNKRNTGLIYFSAFALPVLMFLLLCAVNNKLPFGESSYLGGDMINQYINFFSYMQSIVTGENDAFYTYAKALGGDMTGIWAYYLLSPLNVVLFFVPVENFPLAITCIIAAKIGLCGLTMAILLNKLHRASLGVLIFSSAYALMSYNLVYFNNIMWLDGVYLLPLIVLGLERVVAGKSAWLYIITLACALIFNYYIAYMICVFLVIFFIYRVLPKIKEKETRLLGLFFRFALGSILAGGLAAVVLDPTFLALSGTKASFDLTRLSMTPLYTLSQHLSKLVCGAMPTGYVEGDEVMRALPNIYCGAVTSVFAVMYFFNSSIKRSARLEAAIFTLLIYLSCNYNGTYLMWHAFNSPALFPYRNAFIISFMMIWFAWQCYVHKDGIKVRGLILTVLVLLFAVLIIDPINNHMVSKKMMFLDIAAMVVCISLILQKEKWFSKRVCALALAAVQCFLLVVNGDSYASGGLVNTQFKDSYNLTLENVNRVKQYDNGFYRLVKPNAGSNMSMLCQFSGLDHFSSTEKSTTKNFVINFGFVHFQDVWVHYRTGATASGDAFLGFKYLLENPAEYKGYEAVSDGDFYFNPNALALAFPADREVLTAELDEENIFLWQEQVFSSALGRDAGIFTPQKEVEHEVLNMSEKPFRGGGIEYNQIETDKEHALIYRFTVTQNDPLYMYTTMPFVEAEVMADLSVNGKDMGPYLGSYHWRAVYLGAFEPGEELEIVISPQAPFFLQHNTFFAYEDQSALALTCDEINSRSENAVLEKVKNSHLRWSGTVTEESPVLLFTVPNDKGWRAEVDGGPAEILTALNTLIALELTPGEHCVELRFTPPGLYAGLGMSLGAMLIFVILILKRKI